MMRYSGAEDFLSLTTRPTLPNPGDSRSPLCVGLLRDATAFSLVRALPSTTSAKAITSLFGDFIGVGSEVARLRASHRPPLKLYVRFSRIQLSRRLILPGCK